MERNASGIDPAVSVAAKVHRRIVPLLMAGWFIAYIDRFNVSFAGLQMNEDLGISSAAFGLGAGLFFLGYALFEIPSNVILARVGPRRWLGRIMVTWGLISMAMMWTQDARTFYALRFLLGVAEAGCFPGMAFYLTRWLSARERATALASLATMSMVSGVAGAPMAAGLLALDGMGGLAGWQWLFVAEGLPAVVIGVLIYRYLPDDVNEARWLTDAEREWLRSQDVQEGPQRHAWAAVRRVISDGRYWMWGLAFACATGAGSALRLFQPRILQEVTGQGDVVAALLTAVPSAVGVIAILVIGRHATRHDERRLHAGLPTLVAAVGLGFVGITYGLVGALVVASVATIGVGAQPPLFASVSSASTGETNAVGIAFVNSVAALGAFLGPFLVGYALDQTGSLAIVCFAAACVMAVSGVLMLATPERRATETRAATAPGAPS